MGICKRFALYFKQAHHEGGWVMNDEATTTARDIVNQMQTGHLWLAENIGVAPRIAFR